VAIKLAKAGYGKPQEILEYPLDIVIGIIAYEKFIPEYEEKFIEVNKENA
jgi:hypothetical protein